MTLSKTAHTSRPWRIHEIAPDFQVEDVWALPTPGGPDELARLADQFAADDFPNDDSPLIVRFLWEARWKIGAVLGLDGKEAAVGARVPSLRDRLPDDLRAAPTGPAADPFTSVYQLEDEWASELANRTVHTIMHIGWVPDGAGWPAPVDRSRPHPTDDAAQWRPISASPASTATAPTGSGTR